MAFKAVHEQDMLEHGLVHTLLCGAKGDGSFSFLCKVNIAAPCNTPVPFSFLVQ